MVSFDDIQNMARGYKSDSERVNYDPKNTALIAWIFAICYMISTNLGLVFPSIASLLGMYYSLGDIFLYIMSKYRLRQDTVEVTDEANNDEDHKEEGDQEEGDQEEGDQEEGEQEEGDQEDDDQEDHDQEEYDEGGEVDEEDEDLSVQYTKDFKGLRQLREFADKINKRNLERLRSRESDDDYSDMPPLIPLSNVNLHTQPESKWYYENLVSYKNQNLRTAGHYAASYDETDD